jgi:hypothetical protein
MSLFNTIIKPSLNELQATQNLHIDYMPKLKSLVGSIKRGQNIVIGGKTTGGKTSLADYIYVLQVYRQWFDLEEEERYPLKIIYFGPKHKLKYKLLKLLALYFKLQHNKLISVSSFMGDANAQNTVNLAHESIQQELGIAEHYLKDLFDTVLEYYDGKLYIEDIEKVLKNHLDSVGTFDANNHYTYHDPRTTTIVIVNNTNYLHSLGNTGQRELLKRKLIDICLKYNRYMFTTIVIVPTYNSNHLQPILNDVHPFNEDAQLVYLLYNPSNDHREKYLNYNMADFIGMHSNSNRFRILDIAKNEQGTDNVRIALAFLGECGSFTELPSPSSMELLQMITKIKENT